MNRSRNGGRRWTDDDLRALDRHDAGRVMCDVGSALIARAVRESPPISEAMEELERLRRQAERKKLEALMLQHLVLLGCAMLFKQYARFHPTRQWQLDFYAEECSVAIEIHGATYANGRHVRGKGFQEDRRKMNAALELGIIVLEYDSEMLRSGEAAAQIERVLTLRGWTR